MLMWWPLENDYHPWYYRTASLLAYSSLWLITMDTSEAQRQALPLVWAIFWWCHDSWYWHHVSWGAHYQRQLQHGNLTMVTDKQAVYLLSGVAASIQKRYPYLWDVLLLFLVHFSGYSSYPTPSSFLHMWSHGHVNIPSYRISCRRESSYLLGRWSFWYYLYLKTMLILDRA